MSISQTDASPRRGAEELRLIAVFAICAALVFLNRGGISFLFPTIKPQLHLSNTQLGQLMAATSLAWAVSSVCFSLVSDILRIRPRTVIIFCVIGFSIVGAAAGAVSTFPALLTLRGAMGVFEGPVIPLIQSTIIAGSSPERRGANRGLIIGGSGFVASVLAPALLVGLANTIGWRFAFLAIAIPGPLIALAIWFVTRGVNNKSQNPVAEQLDRRIVFQLATQRTIILAAVGSIALIGQAVALLAFLPSYVDSLSTFSPSGRVTLLVALGGISNVGGIVVPALSDRFGRRACLAATCLASVIGAGALVMLSTSAWWVFPVAMFSFIAGGSLTLMVYVIPGETVLPQMAASTFSILLFIGEIIGGTIAPAVAGWVADRYGLTLAQLVPGALGAVAFIVTLLMREPISRKPRAIQKDLPLVSDTNVFIHFCLAPTPSPLPKLRRPAVAATIGDMYRPSGDIYDG